MKILSPAGNMLSLKSAIFNGADEVYLGVNEFNARNNIDGFSLQTLKDAVELAHVFGVKVNLAVNILFLDDELQVALDLIKDAYNLGVDYFIIQDLGLISLIKKHYPEITVHASTQMGVHNLEGVKALDKYGIKRFVLARETPLNEIKRVKENSGVEIEYFAHGALCVSFSGNCYLSSYLFNASGNRGRCKQLCRLTYTLKKGGKKVKSGFLLSAKDFNMLGRLGDLEKAGVDVIKIEGRARRPFYVATATKAYKNALDGKKASQTDIELAFNRGFNEGYFNGNSGVISKLNNHVGVYVGKVKKVNKGKTFNEVFFDCNFNLSPKSTFKIFAQGKEKTTFSAFDLKEISSGKYRTTTTHQIESGDEIRLILDAQKEKQAEEFMAKRMVDVSVSARVNEPIKATVSIEDEQIEVCGEVLSSAKNSPLTKQDVSDCFSKSEYFCARLTFVAFDNVFIQKAKLNEFRRRVYESVFLHLTKTYRLQLQSVQIGGKKHFTKLENYQIIDNVNVNFVQKHVIYSPEVYIEKDVLAFVNKCISANKKPYLDTPNFALQKDVELLKSIVKNTGVGVVANNYYALTLTNNLIIGGGLNVYNSYTANELGAPVIVAEDGVCQREDFAYMTLRHCPIKEHVGGTCGDCKYADDYEYVTEDGKQMKLKRKKLSTCTFYLIKGGNE